MQNIIQRPIISLQKVESGSVQSIKNWLSNITIIFTHTYIYITLSVILVLFSVINCRIYWSSCTINIQHNHTITANWFDKYIICIHERKHITHITDTDSQTWRRGGFTQQQHESSWFMAIVLYIALCTTKQGLHYHCKHSHKLCANISLPQSIAFQL